MTPASTPQSRAADVLGFFERHLVGHFHAEEEALFPFLRERWGDPDRDALLEELIADHRRLEALRNQLAAADGETVVIATLVAFADLLEAHVRREERELFEHFPDGIGAGDAEKLDTAIRALLARHAPG
jgi:hemerythrin-like domain-containing protein